MTVIHILTQRRLRHLMNALVNLYDLRLGIGDKRNAVVFKHRTEDRFSHPHQKRTIRTRDESDVGEGEYTNLWYILPNFSLLLQLQSKYHNFL